MTTREMVYAVLAVSGVLIPTYYSAQYTGTSSEFLIDFFRVPMGNVVTASLLFDLLIASIAFNVLLFAEGRPLGIRNFWVCVGVSWLVALAAGLGLQRSRLRGPIQHVQAKPLDVFGQIRAQAPHYLWRHTEPFLLQFAEHGGHIHHIGPAGAFGHPVATDTAAEFFNCHEKACKTLP